MSYTGLTAYQKGFELAMRIFHISKSFPTEEKYSLTDQVRRSSRSICVNIAEGYRKRIYPLHFVAKISDADMENTETQVWLNFALESKYIAQADYNQLIALSDEVGRLLNHIEQHPSRYGALSKS
jgi:four helix bundle protein